MPVMGSLLFILLHPEQRGVAGDIWSLWHWEPSVVAGCALVVVWYLWSIRGNFGWRSIAFFGGVAILLLALVSPIDVLSDDYLFSAHMLQHLVLILVVPPMLLLGVPGAVFERILANPLLRRIERVFRGPVLAWVLAMSILFVWHIPALYNAALANDQAHVVQHLCFLVSSVIFWWPLLSPVESSRVGVLGAVTYLFAATLATMLLGIYFTFAPPGLYPAYVNPKDTLGLLSVVRGSWGLSVAYDQQLGGLLMWVPGGLIYLGAIFGVLARWYGAPEAQVEEIEYQVRSTKYQVQSDL